MVNHDLMDLETGAARRLPLGLAELRRIVDNLPAMVSFWDADGRNGYANQAYVEWFGIAPDQLLGMHVSELLGPELFGRNRPHIEAALRGERQQFERTQLDAAGRTRLVQSTYVPNIVGGLPAGFFVMSNDITERSRTEHALQESIRQVALLEERQRIAADLHDYVVQRLFAAGLDLAAAKRQGDDAGWQRVALAAEGVDEAIRELRRSIHSLRELMAPNQVPESIERVIGNAGRVLGFLPRITYTGNLEEVPASVVQELLAVLNEALSNVARHAQAERVDVTVACADGQLLLRVADDGRGLGQPDRSSGLSNMRRRAEVLGGSFVWRENHPRGTVVDWMVPLGG
jgi:two-component system, NarL family, sensor histidine kinase DevS